MISQTPTSEPTANSRLAQLTRLASASFGTSMPVPAATAARSRASRSFWCSSAATVTGSSAERCRCTRAPRAVPASSTRAAADGRPLGAGPHRHRARAPPPGRSSSRASAGARGGRPAEVTDAGAPAGHQDGVAAQGPVREAGVAQPQHRPQHLVQRAVGEVGAGRLRQDHAVGQAGDQGRIPARVRTAPPRSRRAGARAPGRRA